MPLPAAGMLILPASPEKRERVHHSCHVPVVNRTECPGTPRAVNLE